MLASKYIALKKAAYANSHFSIVTIDGTYIQQIREWRNSQLDILRQSKPISEKEQEVYFAENVFTELTKDNPSLVLFNFFQDGKFIGYGGIVHISYTDKIGEISFLLDPVFGKAAHYETAFANFLQLIDEVAFSDLQLEKLFTETYDTRIENIAILEKCGYTREGVLRSHKLINDKRSDVYLHGRLKNEYQ